VGHAVAVGITMNNEVQLKRKRNTIMEILIPIVAIVLWIILQAWVLPRFGIKT
jgi:hypothetical protein